jgi:thiosulfate/3-mercaptopyruvate sulfurtransferase
MGSYAHPEMLVDTAWVAAHRLDPDVRIVEVDGLTSACDLGHIPGAVTWSWTNQLCDGLRRDIILKADFERLMEESGIGNKTTVILYGDNDNWFAAWALWQMKIYGHEDVRLMDGGRKKWRVENRQLTMEVPELTFTRYEARDPDLSIRAFLPDVQKAVAAQDCELVDVRSPEEFSGELRAPPGLAETCQRGGHIPGAHNIPWSEACNDNGTFKTADELYALYEAEGVTADHPVIAYCRIGERSSHSWFALKYLLGYPDVRNYDGSWTEWGNMVRAPIERAGLENRARPGR